MNEMERDMANLDENNPRHMAHLMRKMKDLMPPGSMPKEMETAIKRLEAGEDPEKIEADLMKLVPRNAWTDWSHWLIWHGRRRCFARKPDCANCEVFRLCPSGKVFLRTGVARKPDE